MPGLTCNACNMLFENESFITAPIGTVTISSARKLELLGLQKSCLRLDNMLLLWRKANQMKGLCFTPAESAVKVTGVPRLMNSIASLGATFCAFHKGQQATEMRM
ncbi:hypothetical protein YC2023_044826 [Brassica napus]|uniref:(rape) hypothetical protein n=1 Tax=Brassica napus TaxID=3708 RepID=A0A817APP0_BRANA|nr:unnamed protein product [Brassica napus]